jgi:hypothetical protein
MSETPDPKAIRELMDLQGELRVRMLALGVTDAIAGDAAAEALDLFVTSPVASETHRNAYRILGELQRERPAD